jgi:hypothetical protein
MDKREVKKTVNRLIMQINAVRRMDERQRRNDLIYGIVLMVLFLAPLLIGLPWLLTVGKPLMAVLIILAGWLIGAGIGLSRRRQIINSFLKVKDAESLIELKDGEGQLEKLKKVDPVLLFPFGSQKELLELAYNWLVRQKLISEGERLTAYRFTGKQLKNEITLNIAEDLEVMLVPLEGRQPEDFDQLVREGSLLNLQVLSGILKKPAGEQ